MGGSKSYAQQFARAENFLPCPGRMGSSWYSPLTRAPNQIELPKELPGQTGPPVQIWKWAQLLAGISACATLQAGTLSTNV